MSASQREPFFVTCPTGLEPLLEAEMRELRLVRTVRGVRGVAFEGSIHDAWRANLHLRTAVRVLWRVARFAAPDPDALYAGVAALDWARFLSPERTFRVIVRSRDSALDHTLFVAQRTKDAVVDTLREPDGRRPSVDLDDPDLRIHVHLYRDRCTLSIDTSGASLHRRGWRRTQGPAPLSEVLAAAVLSFSGWNRRAPLLDPFCGSGTLLCEAAALAAGRAPGLSRERFAFEALPNFDAAAWSGLRSEAQGAEAPPRKLVLRGSDASPAAIEGAGANLEAAGLSGRVELEVADAGDFAPRRGWNAWVVTNPPYGERLGDERALAPVYRAFGAALRDRCAGYRLALLSGNPRLASELELPPAERVALRNGAIDCELLLADL
ncbi:MAG: RNA methyltransferase [Planctomycetes bacterium]|jgi:23S rRNA G2445 N2-methylase RlmL|nr:RNA methyltransferase [Planctomycetota bacterium]MDP6407838.1 THUMP domain-containing protein [Planctomycetota bacterium]